MSALTLKEGEAFNLGKMSRDQRTMRNEFYGREGFVFVDIEPEPHHLADEPNKLDLVYRISEGDRLPSWARFASTWEAIRATPSIP